MAAKKLTHKMGCSGTTEASLLNPMFDIFYINKDKCSILLRQVTFKKIHNFACIAAASVCSAVLLACPSHNAVEVVE